VLEEMGFQSTPKLSCGDGGRAQVVRKTVPDDRSDNAETSFVEFRCCSLHDQQGRVANSRPVATVKTGRVARPITDAL